MLKSAYVGFARGARNVADRTGVIGWLDKRQHSRSARWARSLFAIYDIDAMVALDLPWWTFDAIDKVDAMLRSRPSARVFEYGSGASTVWLGRRAASVISVEHDAPWHQVVTRHVAALPNVDLRLVPPDARRDPDALFHSTKPGWRDVSFRAYVEAIDAVPGDFDVIVIDGRTRSGALAHAKTRLKPDGIIVFDNSARSHYQAAIRNSGLKRRDYSGLAACLPYLETTTLLSH